MVVQYSAVELGKGVNERITPKVSSAGYAWTNGAVLTMFKRFGQSLKPSDYKGFEPSWKHVDPVDQKSGKRKKGKAVQSTFDDEFGPPSNIVALSQQPSQPVFERNASKLSLSKVSPGNLTKKQNPKNISVKSTNKNEFEQFLNEPSSSKQRFKKKPKKKASNPTDEFEPPQNVAAKSEQPTKKKRTRRESKKSEKEESGPPSNETTFSEQPRKKEVVRKASKRFVDESKPSSDETAPAEQTTKKRRRRKSSKLSDDEESEPFSGEVGTAEQPKRKDGKRRKGSRPTRTA